jgi:hypothetical protein
LQSLFFFGGKYLDLTEAIKNITAEYIKAQQTFDQYADGLKYALNVLEQIETPHTHLNSFQVAIVNNNEPIDEFSFKTEVGEIKATVYANSNLSPMILTSSSDSERLLKFLRAKNFEIFICPDKVSVLIFYTTTEGNKVLGNIYEITRKK